MAALRQIAVQDLTAVRVLNPSQVQLVRCVPSHHKVSINTAWNPLTHAWDCSVLWTRAFLLCILLLGKHNGLIIENKDLIFSYHPSPARNFILASFWIVLEYLIFLKKFLFWMPSMMIHAFDPSAQEVEVGRSLWIPGQPSYTVEPCLKQNKMPQLLLEFLTWVSWSRKSLNEFYFGVRKGFLTMSAINIVLLFCTWMQTFIPSINYYKSEYLSTMKSDQDILHPEVSNIMARLNSLCKNKHLHLIGM